MSFEDFLIGFKLKEFRKEAGFSLAKAAKHIGVSSAFISMVENGKCGISFHNVHALVALYGKTLADIASTSPTDGRVVNLDAMIPVASEDGVKIFGLAKHIDSSVKVDGFQLYFEQDASHEFDCHEGIEYVLVLEGTFELVLKKSEDGTEETRNLVKGDTTSYSANDWHRFRNTSGSLASLFIIEVDAK